MAKKFTFTITANVVGEDGVEMFNNVLTYKNMEYGDVVAVEKALVGALDALNKLGEEKAKAKAKEAKD